jgi:DNA-binding PadR family transcriptional regulator
MLINNAILGLLSYRPMTGYEIKKIIQDSSYMHWSGNNNQIYKALLELAEDGFVTGELELQEKSPAKKIYTITEEGRNELKDWTKSEPEALDFKKAFLIQLAWSDVLSGEELIKLLGDYENEVRLQLIMNREKIKRGSTIKARTEREEFLWRMIDDNILSSYQNELDWIRRVRTELPEHEEREEAKMNYRITENGAYRYLELLSSAEKIGTEQAALDLVSLCGENEVNLLVLHGSSLHEDFFKLKTGVAGAVLQKLLNYYIRTAIILPEQEGLGIRFKELISEANKGSQYCFPKSLQEAEAWFMRIK